MTWMLVVMNEHWNICRYVIVAVSIVSYILCGVCTIFICFSRLELFLHVNLLKLVIEPDSLQLEVRRGETNGKGHNQTSTLLLMEQGLVAQ